MRAETIAIGTELLLGELVDTNSAHIARELRNIGLDLWHMSAVGDNAQRIADAIRLGLQRSGVVITTGGLGPTEDDKTRQAVALATGRDLVFSAVLLSKIEARFARFGRRMSPNNRQQAYLPEGAIAIENPVGTAPIFIVDQGDGIVIVLPGVPREMKHLLEHEIIPWLRNRLDLQSTIKARVLRTTGLGESVVDQKIRDLEQLSNPTVGLAAHTGIVDVRITAKAPTEAEADAMIAGIEATVRDRLGSAIFGVNGDSLAAVALDRAIALGLTVATIEAGTDGMLSQQMAKAGNSAGRFLRGEMLPAPDHPLSEDELVHAACDIATRAGAGIGLACLIAVHEKTHDIGISLAQPGSGKYQTHLRTYDGYHEYARNWSVNSALNMLRIWQTGGD